jgi:hypothetical protein
MSSTTLPFSATMDTPADRKAAKKRRLREKRAAAHIPKPATVADTNPPVIIAPNVSIPTSTATENSEYPNKAIEDLWRSVARRAAKKAWQDKYVKKQM